MTGRAATGRGAPQPSVRAPRTGRTPVARVCPVRGRALAHSAAPTMDRRSTSVPEVTPTRAEAAPEGSMGKLPDPIIDGRPPGWIRTNATTLRRTGEPMPPSDPLSALLDPVRAAAREDSTQALDPRDAPGTRSAPRFVDERALSLALGVSATPVDQPWRQRRHLSRQQDGPTRGRSRTGARTRS
jgi:hypothetical protein